MCVSRRLVFETVLSVLRVVATALSFARRYDPSWSQRLQGLLFGGDRDRARGGRARSESRELVLYDQRWTERVHHLVFGGIMTLFYGGEPVLLEDNVPMLVSFMDSASLLPAGAVSRHWNRIATSDSRRPRPRGNLETREPKRLGVDRARARRRRRTDRCLRLAGYWRVIVREDYSVDPSSIDPPPRPVKALWLKMKRAFRSLLAEQAPPPPGVRAPLPVVGRILVH